MTEVSQAPTAHQRTVRREVVIVAGGTALFVLVFGVLAIRQLQMFAVHAFDFAIFDQGLWLLSRFQDPFSTVRGLPLFADHSSYILILLTPLYWLWADPRVLVFVTVGALAAGAPLAYALSRSLGAGVGLALATAAGYLLHPAASWNIWEGFHPEVLVVPLLIAAFLLIVRDRPWWGFALVAVALLAKEDVGLVVAPLGVYVAWVLARRRVGIAMAVAGTAAFVVNVAVILPALSPTGDLIYTGRLEHLGTGPLGIIGGMLTSPSLVAGELFNEPALVYVAALLLPLPLAVLAPRLLLAGVPFLAFNLLSSNPFQSDVRYHYTSYLLVVVVLAAATGAARLAGRSRQYQQIGIVVTLLMATAWHLGAGPSPITNTDAWRVDDVAAGHVAGAVALIPPADRVSAWDTAVPHLAHRRDVYLFPNPFRDLGYGTERDSPPDPAAVQWVLLRLDQYPDLQADAAAVFASRDFDVVYESGPVILLRRLR